MIGYDSNLSYQQINHFKNFLHQKTYGSWQATNIFVIVSVSLTDMAKHNALGYSSKFK